MPEALSFANEREGLAFFDRLEPLMPAEMIGLWQGCGVPSGHPLDGVLENLGWYGKRFHADRHADALLFSTGGRRLAAVDPAGIPLRFALRFSKLGRTKPARNLFFHLIKSLWAKGPVASLQSLPFRGKTSTAMVYDRQPITDHFRRLDDDRLLGVMIIDGDPRIYFFILERSQERAG
jgi:Domain of unknown function (DUF4334)/GXWXG protein